MKNKTLKTIKYKIKIISILIFSFFIHNTYALTQTQIDNLEFLKGFIGHQLQNISGDDIQKLSSLSNDQIISCQMSTPMPMPMLFKEIQLHTTWVNEEIYKDLLLTIIEGKNISEVQSKFDSFSRKIPNTHDAKLKALSYKLPITLTNGYNKKLYYQYISTTRLGEHATKIIASNIHSISTKGKKEILIPGIYHGYQGAIVLIMLSETPENIETSRSSFSTNGTIDPLKLYGAVIVKWVKSRGLLDYIFPQHYDYNGRFIIQGCSSAGNDIEMKIDDSSIGFINTYVSNSPLPLENLGQVTSLVDEYRYVDHAYKMEISITESEVD